MKKISRRITKSPALTAHAPKLVRGEPVPIAVTPGTANVTKDGIVSTFAEGTIYTQHLFGPEFADTDCYLEISMTSLSGGSQTRDVCITYLPNRESEVEVINMKFDHALRIPTLLREIEKRLTLMTALEAVDEDFFIQRNDLAFRRGA